MIAPARLARRLRHDRAGVAMMEFALAFPVIFAAAGYGIEMSNFALTEMRVNQYALNVADNASRVGLNSSLSTVQLRESDVDDVFQGLRLESAGLNLVKNGRVILSSLENVQQSWDTAAVQRIHWQRCIGQMTGTGYKSSYGDTLATDGTKPAAANQGTAAPTGMGDSWGKVSASTGTGVAFVEINYLYQPIFGTLFMPQQRIIHYTASFVVRDNNRDFSQLFNFTPTATQMTCDKAWA